MALLKKLKKFIRELVSKWIDSNQVETKLSEEEFQFDKDQIEKFLNQFLEVTGHSLKEVLELETGYVESIRLKLPDMNLHPQLGIVAIAGGEIYEVTTSLKKYDREASVVIKKDNVVTEYRVLYDLEIEKSNEKYCRDGNCLVEVDYEPDDLAAITWYFPNYRQVFARVDSFEEELLERGISAIIKSLKKFKNYKEGDSFEIFEVLKKYISEIQSVHSSNGQNPVDTNTVEIENNSVVSYELYNHGESYKVLKRDSGKFISTAKLKTAEVTITTDGKMSVLLQSIMNNINIGDIIQKFEDIQKLIFKTPGNQNNATY